MSDAKKTPIKIDECENPAEIFVLIEIHEVRISSAPELLVSKLIKDPFRQRNERKKMKERRKEIDCG